MKYAQGTIRFVLLIGPYAFKFPIFWNWKKFLKGMLANLSENFQYKVKFKQHPSRNRLCPTFFTLAGFVNIMGRAEDLIPRSTSLSWRYKIFSEFTHDLKPQNFGAYNHTVVLVDYDDTHYNCSECEVYLRNKNKIVSREPAELKS